ALDCADEVEVTRRNQHAAIGDDALARGFRCAINTRDVARERQLRITVGGGERRAGRMEEAIRVALDEVTVAGFDFHIVGPDAGAVLDTDTARRAVDLDQTT